MDLPVPTPASSSPHFGRYQILGELGRGGMATVYRAHDPRFEREVAIKVLPHELLHDPTFRARFEREAKTIAALEYSAIVPVHDFGEEQEQPYLVMRYMTGGSLEDRIKQAPISLAETARIFTRLAPALDKAHARGIIHRDLKPGNILFDECGDAYLSDFGIVKLTEATHTLTSGGIVGTPAYMSPEQGRGEKDIDGRSDLYSMGAILFHMLSGKLPYESDTPTGMIIRHITDPVPDLLQKCPGLPYEIQKVLERAMAKNKNERYATTAELASALEELASRKEVRVETAKIQPAPVTAPPKIIVQETLTDDEPLPQPPANQRRSIGEAGTLAVAGSLRPGGPLAQAPAHQPATEVDLSPMPAQVRQPAQNAGNTPISVVMPAASAPPKKGANKLLVFGLAGGAGLVVLALLCIGGYIILSSLNIIPSRVASAPATLAPTAAVAVLATNAPAATAPPELPTAAPTTAPAAGPLGNGSHQIWTRQSETRDGEFLSPNMVAVDRINNVYVTDYTCQVQVFDIQGKFIRRWGKCGSGPGEFSRAEGIAVDTNGLVYVVDKYMGVFSNGHGRVEVFQTDGSLIKTWGDLAAPSGIAIGPDGNIYVIEQDANKVSVFTSDGTPVGGWGSYGTAAGQFDFRDGFPSGIAVSADGFVYVADMGNNRIQKFSSSGEVVKVWGTDGTNPGQISWPLGLAVSSKGIVFEVDGQNHRIQTFDANGGYLSTFGKPGGAGAGEFGNSWLAPYGIAITQDNLVVVADATNQRIQVFGQDHTFLRQWGKMAYGATGELLSATGVVVGPDGTIFVADSGHQSIARYSQDNQYLGSWNFASLSSIEALDIDAAGNVYAFDYNSNQIAKISAKGNLVKTWGGHAWTDNHASTPDGQFECPGDMVVSKDNLYATDVCANQIQVFDLNGNYLRKWKTKDTNGNPISAYKIAADAQGNVYTFDVAIPRFLVYSPDGALLSEWKNFGDIGDKSRNISAFRLSPAGILVAVDYQDKLFILWDARGGYLRSAAFDGFGTSWYSGIALDGQDGIYITNNIGLTKYTLAVP